MNSFYSTDELSKIGFKHIGNNVLLSKKTSIYGAENIYIGDNTRIDDFCILSGNITIGNYVHIAAFCSLFAGNEGIEMQDFSAISSKGTIYAQSDDYSGISFTNPTLPMEYRNVHGGKVVLERHVIIGASTVIMPNITIKEGAAIGACCLVLKDCNPWTVYVGIPVKEIKKRKKDLLALEKTFLKSIDSSNK